MAAAAPRPRPDARFIFALQVGSPVSSSLVVLALALLHSTAGQPGDEPEHLAGNVTLSAIAEPAGTDASWLEASANATTQNARVAMGPVLPPNIPLPPLARATLDEAIEASRFCVHSSDIGRFCSSEVTQWLNFTRTAKPTPTAAQDLDDVPPPAAARPEPARDLESHGLEPPTPPSYRPHDPLPPAEASTVSSQPDGRNPFWAAVAFSLIPLAVGIKLAALLGQTLRARRSRLRDDIMDVVTKAPGIRHAELVRRIGRGNGTIEHHVGHLIRAGRAFRVQSFGATCYFPASFPEKDALALASLAGETSRRVARAVLCTPGISLVGLAEDLAISKATAHYHVQKLVDAGLVEDCRAGGRRRLRISDSALPTLGLAYLAR